MPKEDRFYEHQKAAARQLEVLYTKNKLSLHLLESPNLQEGFNNTDLDNPKQ